MSNIEVFDNFVQQYKHYTECWPKHPPKGATHREAREAIDRTKRGHLSIRLDAIDDDFRDLSNFGSSSRSPE